MASPVTASQPEADSQPDSDTASVARWWAQVRWIYQQLDRTVGRPRMLRVSFEAFLGSSAVGLLGFSTLFAIRQTAEPETGSIAGIEMPSLPLPVFLIAIMLLGVIGGWLFFIAERDTSATAVALGDTLRSELAEELASASRRGWPAGTDAKPVMVAHLTLVGSVREITLAAREVVRLPGPASMLLMSGIFLFAIEPVVTALLGPIALCIAGLFIVLNRRISAQNRQFDNALNDGRTDITEGVQALLASGDASDFLSRLSSTQSADRALHDQMLEPMRMRAIGTAGTAAAGAGVLLLFVWQAADGETIDVFNVIIYLVVARLAVNAATRASSSILQVSRRTAAIDRYQTLRRELIQYESPSEET